MRTFLDLAAFRHKLISSNVANVATPGYKSRDINFGKEFARLTGDSSNLSGRTTHPGHIAIGSHGDGVPKITEKKVNIEELNSIDIDREISELAKNELLYTVGAELMRRKFEGLRNAIKSS